MPKVSIIIPTFNRAAYLKKAIESIFLQDYTDYEIIVTDNSSTDNTEEVIKSFHDDRIVYQRNDENVGITNNHNIALKLCKGEYIHIFSDDDIMLQGCIRKKVAVLDSFPTVGVVHSDIKIIGSDDEVISETHWAQLAWKHWSDVHKADKLFKGKKYHRLLYKIHNLIGLPSAMIRRSVIDKIGYFDPSFVYILDWDFWLRLTLFYDVYYIKDKLILFRSHQLSTTSKVSSLLFTERRKMKAKLIQSFPNDAFMKDYKYIEFLQKAMYYSDYSIYRIFKIILKKILYI
ncbi:glycosyltransferase [uncultured Mucilaginibacter sp.]|uniref:glycosyltransferase n=1 Tax=uncultured Mucilaginibacter sp. TaxID=797541 RepID=UPI002632C5E4|nr:glycosyltransferase [uncultured Mucilaginibacter sp.]